jgi:perosamine synthetase
MDTAFLVPKDPKLRWAMLLPTNGNRELVLPLNGKRTHHVFWARNAIYHGLKALHINSDDHVLVPSFHCTSVVEPILRSGAGVRFYEIDKDLRPNLKDIEQKIGPNTKALLAIHYFGLPQAVKSLQTLCKQRGIYLIEDCAHVLVGKSEEGKPLGSYGDISIFSWRKFLPLYDGGQLVINNPDLGVDIPWEKSGTILSFKIAKNIFEKVIDDANFAAIKKLGAIFAVPFTFARRLATSNGNSPKALSVNSYDLNFDLASVNLPMSGLSQHILRNTDISDVVAKRRRNFNRILEGLTGVSGVTPVCAELLDGVCPWVFPLLVNKTREFHLALRDRGIPATTWSGVIHRDLPLDQYPTSKYLYENLIFLPVHQSLTDAEISMMLTVLRSELAKSSVDVSAAASSDFIRDRSLSVQTKVERKSRSGTV